MTSHLECHFHDLLVTIFQRIARKLSHRRVSTSHLDFVRKTTTANDQESSKFIENQKRDLSSFKMTSLRQYYREKYAFNPVTLSFKDPTLRTEYNLYLKRKEINRHALRCLLIYNCISAPLFFYFNSYLDSKLIDGYYGYLGQMFLCCIYTVHVLFFLIYGVEMGLERWPCLYHPIGGQSILCHVNHHHPPPVPLLHPPSPYLSNPFGPSDSSDARTGDDQEEYKRHTIQALRSGLILCYALLSPCGIGLALNVKARNLCTHVQISMKEVSCMHSFIAGCVSSSI